MSNRFYGIEVELENGDRVFRNTPPSHWIREGDGSLRNNGVELKSYGPLPLDIAEHSLLQLDDYFTRNQIEVEANTRCSVHIHMDVRDMSNTEVYNMLCNYSLIEPMFFAYVGGGREDSHFCVPYYHCKETVRNLMHTIKEHDPTVLGMHGRKYMAVNVLPMVGQGSVEWRQFPAVLPITSVVEWLHIIDAIKVETVALGRWADDHVMEFCQRMLPGTYDEDKADIGRETYYYHLLAATPVRRHQPPDIDFGHEEEEEEPEWPDEPEEEEEPDDDLPLATRETIERARERLAAMEFNRILDDLITTSQGGEE